jgi:hypothetical protein
VCERVFLARKATTQNKAKTTKSQASSMRAMALAARLLLASPPGGGAPRLAPLLAAPRPPVAARLRAFGVGANAGDNDPKVLEAEKRRNLSGETEELGEEVAGAVPGAAGWNPKLASDAEAVVKAERAPDMEIEELVEFTVHTVHQTTTATTTETTATGEEEKEEKEGKEGGGGNKSDN